MIVKQPVNKYEQAQIDIASCSSADNSVSELYYSKWQEATIEIQKMKSHQEEEIIKLRQQNEADIQKWRQKTQSKKEKNEKLKRKVRRLEAKKEMEHDNDKFHTIEHLKTLSDQYLNPSASEIMKAQASSGHYTEKKKTICSKIYFSSKRGYERFRSLLRLPSRTTLCKETDKIQFKSGLNQNILNAMEEKLKTCPPSYRHCTIAVDGTDATYWLRQQQR